MPNSRGRHHRAELLLELDAAARNSLAEWLHRELDPSALRRSTGPGLGVVVALAAARDRGPIEYLAHRIGALRPVPISVRLAPELKALPSRARPSLYLLPAHCEGLGRILAPLSHPLAAAGAGLGPRRSFLRHIVVAHAYGGGRPLPSSPRLWPGCLPDELRGPIDAVRLGLYCSQTMPEGQDVAPLAQVELPRAAAVR